MTAALRYLGRIADEFFEAQMRRAAHRIERATATPSSPRFANAQALYRLA
jgi:hypothetical protein